MKKPSMTKATYIRAAELARDLTDDARMKKPSMTKATYIRAAELVRERCLKSDTEFREALISVFCALFSEDNPRFDEGRFREACDPVNPVLRARANARPRPAR